QGIFAAAGLGLNADALTGGLIKTGQCATLQLRINGVGIFGINAAAKTVATLGDKPVTVDDSRGAARARGTAKAVVVLRAAINVIKRRRIVRRDVVKLRNRKVRFEVPVHAAVITFVNASIATHEIVIGVVWINP